jgi:hypothetical protein
MRFAVAIALLIAPATHAAAPPPANSTNAGPRPFIIRVTGANPVRPARPDTKSAPTTLTKEDRRFLDGLFKFLVDPTEAERVRVAVPVRTGHRITLPVRPPGEKDGPEEAHFWRFPAKNGKAARVVVADGRQVFPRCGRKKIDFVQECRDRLVKELRDRHPESFDTDTVVAAWLYKLGHEKLSAAYLHRARERGWTVENLRNGLASRAHEALIYAFVARADAEALKIGQHLLRLYPREAKKLVQVTEIMDDLARREKAGLFGKCRPFPPSGIKKWPVKKRVAYLIASLDDVELPPQRVELGMSTRPKLDARLEALMALGDDAIPALIDAADKDVRPARWVGNPPPGDDGSSVLLACDLAAVCLSEMLHWYPLASQIGEGRDTHTKAGRAKLATKVRAHGKAYGKLKPLERVRARLLDKGSEWEDWESAARYFAWGEHAEISRMAPPFPPADGAAGKFVTVPKGVLDLAKPTAAEALLTRMGRELASPRGEDEKYRNGVLAVCLGCIARLNDPRILPALERRIASAKGAERLALVHVCRLLGQPRHLEEIARALERGLVPPRKGKYGKDSLEDVVALLSDGKRPAYNRALFALAKPTHPLYKAAREKVLTDWADNTWLSHPFCVLILVRELDNNAKTGGAWMVDEGSLKKEYDGGGSMSGELPDFLQVPANRHSRADERRCDLAAHRISRLVAGAPEYSVLAKDAGRRLAALKAFVALYGDKLRLATFEEVELLRGLGSPRASFVPDIRPLGRPATEADVKAGRAVFHLGGKGKLSKRKLPTVAELKGEKGLIVQAEIGPDDKEVFGVLTQHSLRRVEKKDVLRIAPLKGPAQKVLGFGRR